MIGETISHYKILAKIGEGGMGVVYKAEDTKLKRTVALKFLPQELMRDREARERFIQEAQAAAALNHPNICTVYEINEAEGRNFIAMEYIKGHSLKEKIASGPIGIDESLEIVNQIAEGLLEAHENGIIHRDIKPANIMMTRRGQAKIMDFGLAKLEWGVDLTKTATIMGTVAYMSPEQAQGEKVDQRTDIWALGAVLYEMLSGVRPFKSPHDQAAIYAILNEKPEPFSLLRKDIPDDLEKIVFKALTKRPSQRLSSMGELLRNLKSVSSVAIPRGEDKKSIAVLPFENMSADPEQEFFCDGITEEIINALTRLDNLRVIARTSAFAFKGKHEDIREIGRTLDVETLLEGSVRKSGDRLRITAQLIKVSDGSHLWSERFDRLMEDVFDIQDEISLAIVDNLKVKLSVGEEEAVLKRNTDDADVYNLYLLGQYHWNMFTKEDLLKSQNYFEQAIAIDPDYAPAYAGLSISYFVLGGAGLNILPADVAVPKAESMAMKAIALDSENVEAHCYLGILYFWFEWKWDLAEEHIKKALEVNPNSALAHDCYSLFLTIVNRHEESIQEIEEAIRLDPVSPLIYVNAASAYCHARQFDKAIEYSQRAQEYSPQHSIADWSLGYIYNLKQEYEKALSYFESISDAHSSVRDGYRGYVYAKIGEETKARQILNDLKGQLKRGSVSYVALAVTHLGLGEHDEALDYLERAAEERPSVSIVTSYLKVDPLWNPLRSHPRFLGILRKIGFDVADVEPTKSILSVSKTAELKPSDPKLTETKPSIAVLPFVDMSPQKDQEYFCDGIAEELINTLTKIKNINVVARTSAFAFKGKAIDVREMGRMLSVEKVLEGSVRKSGNRIRVTTQLVNVVDGYHLWSEKFDRDMEDIFAIQDEISLAIVDNLKVSLLKTEKEALLKRYTEDIEAYNLYLKGIYFLRMYTAEGFEEAIKYFELTLQKDPNYALAYYGLAEVFYAISFWANVPPHEAYPKAKEYAKKSIEIDDDVGEAHAALGLVYTFYDWNWKEAERELNRALELNPSSAIIHMSYSWFLSLKEKHDEAIFEAKRAQELDPLSPLIISHIGLACIWGSQFDRAIDELKAGMNLAPNFYLMFYYLGLAYRAKSMFKEAIATLEKAVELSGGAPWPALILATNYFESEQTDKGEKLLQNLEQRAKKEYLPPLGFTYVHVARKDLDQAYHWVERAFEEKDSFLPWCAIIPIEGYQVSEERRLRPLFMKYGLVK